MSLLLDLASEVLRDVHLALALQDCSEQVVKYGHQVLVNAQIMLANLGSDAYVLNVDLDEFLVTDNRTTLAEVFDRCAGNESADLPRCGCGAVSSSASGAHARFPGSLLGLRSQAQAQGLRMSA